jgi:hypothetical protein
MERCSGARDAARVSRIIITGGQPQHLSPAEAQSWLRAEIESLHALPGVELAVLTQVSGSPGHPRPWAWVCELHLAAGADGTACVQHPVCSEWLMDLRLLGMRPAVAVLGQGERVV